jgi:hypothetical protein
VGAALTSDAERLLATPGVLDAMAETLGRYARLPDVTGAHFMGVRVDCLVRATWPGHEDTFARLDETVREFDAECLARGVHPPGSLAEQLARLRVERGPRYRLPVVE